MHSAPSHGDDRARARVALSAAAAAASDYAAALVPTLGDEHGAPGDFLTLARRLRVLALDVLEAAVVVERCHGTGWDTIAAALGLTPEVAEQRYTPAVEETLHPAEGAPKSAGGNASALTSLDTDDTCAAARQLDRWVRSRVPKNDPVSALFLDARVGPVSGNLHCDACAPTAALPAGDTR